MSKDKPNHINFNIFYAEFLRPFLNSNKITEKNWITFKGGLKNYFPEPINQSSLKTSIQNTRCKTLNNLSLEKGNHLKISDINLSNEAELAISYFANHAESMNLNLRCDKDFIEKILKRNEEFITEGEWMSAYISTILDLKNMELRPDEIEQLSHQSWLQNTHTLDLSGNRIQANEIKTLLSSKYLSEITELNLSENRIKSSEINSIFNTENLASLKKLILMKTKIKNEGVLQLLNCNQLIQLEVLNLDRNQIEDEGALAFCEPNHLPNLKQLSILNNPIAEGHAVLIDVNRLIHSNHPSDFENNVKREIRNKLEKRFGKGVRL